MRKLQLEDEELYRFFRAKMEREIESFGRERMDAAVAELRRLNRFADSICTDLLSESEPECRILNLNTMRFTRLMFHLRRERFLTENPGAEMPEYDARGNAYPRDEAEESD